MRVAEIRVDGMCKAYGGKRVLEGFQAAFPAGSVTGVVGPSGCGKTTLLHILMGIERADAGTVTGVPHAKSAVFQEDRLLEGFNAVSNVRFVLGHRHPETDIRMHLEQVGLAGSLEQPVSELSGGMRRRVALVRALLAPSDIVFLDEAFKGLDTQTRTQALAYVAANRRGRTVILVTHSPEEAGALGGGLIRMQMPDGLGGSG